MSFLDLLLLITPLVYSNYSDKIIVLGNHCKFIGKVCPVTQLNLNWWIPITEDTFF